MPNYSSFLNVELSLVLKCCCIVIVIVMEHFGVLDSEWDKQDKTSDDVTLYPCDGHFSLFSNVIETKWLLSTVQNNVTVIA